MAAVDAFENVETLLVVMEATDRRDIGKKKKELPKSVARPVISKKLKSSIVFTIVKFCALYFRPLRQL